MVVGLYVNEICFYTNQECIRRGKNLGHPDIIHV